MAVYSTIDQLLALKIPEVQRIFLDMMQGIVDRAMLGEMIKAIEAGDEERLFQATGFTPAALAPILDAIEGSYKDAAETTVDGWPKRILTPTGSVIFRFDMRNTRVETDLRENSSRLVTQLMSEARDNVRATLQQGMIRGDNPRRTALDIIGRVDPVTKKRVGGVIGLTRNQNGWVSSAERYLSELNPRYFNMTLRDKRFDSVVKKAIEGKESLSKAQIDKMITAYKNRALRYRGAAIARTETIQAVNRAEFTAAMQIVDEGIRPRSAITKEWDDVGDGRTRLTHRELGIRYGRGKGIDIEAPFISSEGDRLLFPGDSSLGADASEIVHCRCRMRTEIDWFAGVA